MAEDGASTGSSQSCRGHREAPEGLDGRAGEPSSVTRAVARPHPFRHRGAALASPSVYHPEGQQSRGATASTQAERARTVALLNDLLQLDHDAVHAYALAIDGAEDSLHRDTLAHFREDHERHIQELRPLIETRGGVPLETAHQPTGLFKAAVQRAGTVGGEKDVLMAFRANERQVRDKYLRAAAADLPREVAEVVARNAADEVKHYAWASEALVTLGVGPETTMGRAEEAFERVHARTADAIEGAERRVLQGGERLRGSRGPSPRNARGSGVGPLQVLGGSLVAGLLLHRVLR
jgi:hypothetical protein